MIRAIIAIVLSLITTASFASTAEKACSVLVCSAGDNGVTYATKTEPFYICPTRELVDYTSFVLGIVSFNVQMTGKLPNISDKTGEPEYLDDKDGPNKTRLILDYLRNAAHVKTFDQALSLCSKGVGKVKVTVLNSPKESNAIWVSNEKTKVQFWMPRSHLDKK